MHAILNELNELIEKNRLQSPGEPAAYFSMLGQLICELRDLTEVLIKAEAAQKDRLSLKRAAKQWETYMQAFIKLCKNWQMQNYLLLKKTKAYMEMEELMAEIDDWIEGFNEDHEALGLSLLYIEAWDIGVFF